MCVCRLDEQSEVHLAEVKRLKSQQKALEADKEALRSPDGRRLSDVAPTDYAALKKERSQLVGQMDKLAPRVQAAKHNHLNAQAYASTVADYLASNTVISDDAFNEVVRDSYQIRFLEQNFNMAQRDLLDLIMLAVRTFIASVEGAEAAAALNWFYHRAGPGPHNLQGAKPPPVPNDIQMVRAHLHVGFLRDNWRVCGGIFKDKEQFPAEARNLLKAIIKAQATYKEATKIAQKAGFPCEVVA